MNSVFDVGFNKMDTGNFCCIHISNDSQEVDHIWMLDIKRETIFHEVFGTSTSMPVLMQLLFLTLLLMSLPGNIAIFAAVIRNGLKERPINLLILVDQCVNSVQRYQKSIFYQHFLLTKGVGLGTDVCQHLAAVTIFGILNTTMGSLPIAVFRLAMVTSTRAISCKKQQHVLATCLLIICLLANTIMTILLVNSIGKTQFMSVCSGTDKDFAEILMTYNMINDPTSIWPRNIVWTIGFLQPIEGSIYFFIFLHTYRHEKTVWPLLTEKSRQCRRKKNALTMICQFYMYVAEQAFIFGIIMVSKYATHSWRLIWFSTFVQAEFAVRCSVQAMACTETRQELTSLLNKVKQIGVPKMQKQH